MRRDKSKMFKIREIDLQLTLNEMVVTKKSMRPRRKKCTS